MRFIKNTFIFLLLFCVAPLFSQDSLQTVVAQKGDGVLSLLRKQGLNPYELYDEFIDLNSDNLREGIHLYEGVTYKIPGSTKEVEEDEAIVANTETSNKLGVAYEIFGKGNEHVAIKSTKLKGTVYYLISGHGGPDPGAMANYNGSEIAEDEYAYDITLRLARELIAQSALVYIIIRDTDGIRDDRVLPIDHDEVAYGDEVIPLNQTQRLKQRVDIVNKLYKKHKGAYQRLIVTHIDSRSNRQNIDVFFYYHEKSKNGKKFAENIYNTFKSNYEKYQPNRSYTGTFEDRTSLYLVKNTHPVMTYIEIGNIKNKKDQRRILVPDNRQAIAKWITEGAIKDFEN